MKILLDILRGAVIGVANVIPGVSGGTMMVSMGIYDTIIRCVTHLFKEFKKSILTLLPYLIGLVAALLSLSFVVTYCLTAYPLPTNCLFIGLILGGLPSILNVMKDEKKGVTGAVLFIIFFALIIVLQLIKSENVAVIKLSVMEVAKLFFLGALASATMVIPGVSGSMILMLLGYYQPVMEAVKGLVTTLRAGNFAAFGTNIGILLPFGLGVLIGIFAIAKLIEILLARYKGVTYCAILGLVTASPVVILMTAFESGATLAFVPILMSVVCLVVGFAVSYVMAKGENQTPGRLKA